MATPKRVFLNYAREDIHVARHLYHDLKEKSDCEVWFDEESILPGQNWKLEVAKGIRNADIFLLLCSSESVEKTGYLNAEIRQAIDKLNEKNPNQVFVIPARINKCELPFMELWDLHYVDLFPEWRWDDGVGRILRVIGNK